MKRDVVKEKIEKTKKLEKLDKKALKNSEQLKLQSIYEQLKIKEAKKVKPIFDKK